LIAYYLGGDQASTPTIYFVGIAAQSHKVEEFRNTYEGYEKFYKKKRTGFSTVTNEVRCIRILFTC
jgi:hypothetical protein